MVSLETLAGCDPLLGARHLALIRAVLSDNDALGMIEEFAQRLADPGVASNEAGAIAIAVEAAAIIGERHPGVPLNAILAPAAAVAFFALYYRPCEHAARLRESRVEGTATRQ